MYRKGITLLVADPTIRSEKFVCANVDTPVAKIFPEIVDNPVILTLSNSVCPSTSMSLKNVDVPTTVNPPPTILTPLLAVINPTESTFVTSSFVKVPAIETFPSNTASPVTEKVDPSKVNLLLSSSSPLTPATTIRLFVKSEILAVDAVRPDPPEISAPVFASRKPWTLRVLLKVDTPVTNKSSKLVWPSTSKSPFASMLPVNVERPVTERFVAVTIPEIFPITSPVKVKPTPEEIADNAPFSIFKFPRVEIPDIDNALPTILSATTDPPVNSPKTVLKILPAVKIPTANIEVFDTLTWFVGISVPIPTLPITLNDVLPSL